MEASRSENKSKPGRYIIKDDIPIVWSDWEEAYKFNIKDGFPIHRKLTEEHILLTPVSKMRNGLASDVLNSEMLYLMKLYQGTLDVSAVIKFFDGLNILQLVISFSQFLKYDKTSSSFFNLLSWRFVIGVQAFGDSYPCVVYQLGMGLVLILDT
jgi:hypothetical protein